MARHRSRRKMKGRRVRRSRRRSQRGGAPEPIVFTLTNGAGFGSVVNFLCHAYIHAKETGSDFFVENEGWHYSPSQGWHAYFKSLKDYVPSDPPQNVSKYRHATTTGLPAYPLEKYTKAVTDIFVLNDDLAKKARDFINSMGTPYKAIFVRRGDKVAGAGKEMDAINIPDVIKTMDIGDGEKLFVMTDDYGVKEEIEKLLPQAKIFTLTSPESKGADIHALKDLPPEKMKAHAEELFTSVEICMKAAKAWVDNRSNLGRFIKMGAPDTVTLYPADDKNKNIPPNTIINPHSTSLST